MSTLLSFLSQPAGSNQPRVHSYASNVHSILTFKAITKQALVFRQQHDVLAGARVALTLTASAEALMQLVALDGFVAELILLPVDYAPPDDCHFHLTERGQLRAMNNVEATHSLGVTQWRLPGETNELVSYTLSELASNELATSELVVTGSQKQALRWGVMQEPAELAGLLVWLRALKAGEDIVLAQANSLKGLADMFSHAGVTAIAAPPRLWRNLLAGADLSRLHLELAIVNGGMVDEPTLQRIHNIFASAKVVHSFSHTGAGVSWLITDGQPGLPAELVEQQLITIVENRLSLEVTGSDATIKTKYLVEQAGNGRVLLTGHEDTLVTVGGRDVSPEQVEAALMGVAGVMDVQASRMPDPVLGELIRVDVLAPGYRTVSERKIFKQVLQAHCREVLEPWQRPARYYFHA